ERRSPPRGRLRLPGLRALHARLHPPPCEPERAARSTPSLAPQSTLCPGADPGRAQGDRGRQLRGVQTATTGGSDVSAFLILIVLFGAAWLLFVMPARRRRVSHAAMQDSVEVGDEIITAGGLHGTVKSIEEDLVKLEIASGVVVTLDRRAVAAVARDVEVEILDGNPPEPG